MAWLLRLWRRYHGPKPRRLSLLLLDRCQVTYRLLARPDVLVQELWPLDTDKV